MAAYYTITLDWGPVATHAYSNLYTYSGSTYDYLYATAAEAAAEKNTGGIHYLDLPTRPNAARTFSRCRAVISSTTVTRVLSSGYIQIRYQYYELPPRITSNETWTAVWDSACPIADISLNGGTHALPEIYFDSSVGKWYTDYPFATELTALNPITIPTRTNYRFLGCYATNSTSGTKYINADGTPTAAFLALTPTSDFYIYAQWELASYKVTINHASGSSASTTIYAKVGATGAGRFYSDELCTTQITSITPPTRELYQWEGVWSTDITSSAAVQYITSAGAFTSALNSLSITEDLTLNYGDNWTQISAKLTLSGSSWSIPTRTYYLDITDGGVYADYQLTTPVSSVAVPTRTAYRFLGYYSTDATTGTMYIAADGTIQSALQARTEELTIYAQGRAATYTITLNPTSGTTSQTTIYYDATSGDTAFFGTSSAVITSVTVPTYTGNSFLGYWTEESGGDQVISSSGAILSSWVPDATATIYAHWGIDVAIITVAQGAGSGGTTQFWYKQSTAKFYSDAALTTEITSITPPSLRLYRLNGIYTEDGVLAVDSSGYIQSTFAPTEEYVTITATYTRFAYETVLSHNGGSSTISAIYRAPGGSAWYSDITLSTLITSIGVTTRTGYTCSGYIYGTTAVIDSSGNILSAAAVNEDYTASAVWTAKSYTLTFNGNGATPSFYSKTVVYGQAIGTLPTLTNIPSKKTFDEWRISGVGITAETVWTYDSGLLVALATWETFFGNVKDWFSLGSSTLIPESSDSGDTYSHTCAYNATSESPATETSGIWRNPRVTYRVAGDMTLAVTLGAAFKATNTGTSAPTISGYMISAVEVHTAVGEAPTVTVSAVANEGFTQRVSGSTTYYTATATPAIQTYAVSIPISARHRPQNLLSAISGGGELQELTLVAQGDPVVVAENGMPCASDMTHGRVEVTATTAAYQNENAPTAGTDFTKTAEPQSNSGVGYKTFNVSVRKELV